MICDIRDFRRGEVEVSIGKLGRTEGGVVMRRAILRVSTGEFHYLPKRRRIAARVFDRFPDSPARLPVIAVQ